MRQRIGSDLRLVFIDDLQEVLSVLVLQHGLGQFAHLLFADPAVAVGDAFETGNLQALAFLDDFHEGGGLAEAVVCARVEPGEATAEHLHLQLAVFQEALVHRGDLQLATCRGLDMLSHFDDLVGVEIEAHHGVVTIRLFRLLLDAEAVALTVELGYAVTFGVADPIAKHGGFVVFLCVFDGITEQSGEAAAVEDVVAQHEAGAVVADELLADDEGLREAVGGGLLGVFEVDAVVGAVAQEAFEAGEVVGGGDDEDVADTREHQGRDGVIDHRLVVDGEQLFADALGDGVQSCAGPSGENDSFHVNMLILLVSIGGSLREVML